MNFDQTLKKKKNGESLSMLPEGLENWMNECWDRKMPNGYADGRGVVCKDGEIVDQDFRKFNLEGAEFEAVYFCRCKFDTAFIVNTRFCKCHFEECDFHGANLFMTKFEKCEIDETIFWRSCLTGASFKHSDIQGPEVILEECSLIGRIQTLYRERADKMRAISVCGWVFATNLTFAKERKLYCREELEGRWDAAEDIYRNVVEVMRESGRRKSAEDVEFCRRRNELSSLSLPKNRKKVGFLIAKVVSAIDFFTTGGFWSWRRVFFSSVAVISLYACHYHNNPHYTVDSVGTLDGRMLNLVEAFYYSIVTFATLGYGDISPDLAMLHGECWSFKYHCLDPLIVALEGIFGALLIAMFTATILRRSIIDK